MHSRSGTGCVFPEDDLQAFIDEERGRSRQNTWKKKGGLELPVKQDLL